MIKVDRGCPLSAIPSRCPPTSAMSLPLPARCSVDALALPELIMRSAIALGVGTVVPLGYLAGLDSGEMNRILLMMMPLGGAIALTWLAFKLIENRFADLEQRYLDTQTCLRNQERWLQQYSQLSPGNIYILVQAPDGRVYFEYISLAIEAIYDISVDQILADANVLLQRIYPEDKEPYERAVYQSAKNLTTFSHQWRIITPSGQVKWLQGTSQPERRKSGEIAWYGVVVEITGLKQTEAALADSEQHYRAITALDITNRKRLEQALRENEKLFRRAFDDAPIGVSLVTPDGKFLRCNNYYCHLLGYTEEELLQMHYQELTHADDLEYDLDGLARMKRGEIQAFQMEKRYISKQGEIIPVFLNASFVRDEEGIPLYCIGHIQDIRDRLEIDRMKDEFVSIVSHELRTPITAIEGALMLINSGVYDTRPEKAKAMLDIAIKNSNRMVRLVNDILSFERLESGQVQITLETCQVEDLMQQAIDSVSSLAEQSAVTLVVTPVTATFQAAPDAIVQALTNLLTNAIKFSHPRQMVWLAAAEWKSGKVQEGENGSINEQGKIANLSSCHLIHSSAPSPIDPSSSDAKSILFSVRDRGRGIPPEKLGMIFEQFQQVDVSDSRKKGGTGLGLAICKRIVQKHGGMIWVESEPGQGSTFHFTIPVGEEERGQVR